MPKNFVIFWLTSMLCTKNSTQLPVFPLHETTQITQSHIFLIFKLSAILSVSKWHSNKNVSLAFSHLSLLMFLSRASVRVTGWLLLSIPLLDCVCSGCDAGGGLPKITRQLLPFLVCGVVTILGSCVFFRKIMFDTIME